MRRLMVIGFIWVGCALAWMILGGTLTQRGGERDGSLHAEVQLLWGPPMMQLPPMGHVVLPTVDAPVTEEAAPAEAPAARSERVDDVAEPETAPAASGPSRPDTHLGLAAPLRGSDIDVDLDFELVDCPREADWANIESRRRCGVARPCRASASVAPQSTLGDEAMASGSPDAPLHYAQANACR